MSKHATKPYLGNKHFDKIDGTDEARCLLCNEKGVVKSVGCKSSSVGGKRSHLEASHRYEHLEILNAELRRDLAEKEEELKNVAKKPQSIFQLSRDIAVPPFSKEEKKRHVRLAAMSVAADYMFALCLFLLHI